MYLPNHKVSILICSFFISFYLLSSCTTSERSSPLELDLAYVNKQILLRAPNYSNRFRSNDPVNLELKYNTNYEVVFPNDYNLRIFEYLSGKWMEIKEQPTERYPLGDIILSPEKSSPIVHMLAAFPDLPFLGRKYSLRIYVFGDMKVKSTIVKVVAYTDVVLNP